MSLFTAPMEDKLDFLLSELSGVIDAFGLRSFGYSTAPDYKLQKEGGDASIAEANRIMGEPIAFCRILHEGGDSFTGGPDQNVAGSFTRTSHFFGVQLWYEIRASDIEETNGQTDFVAFTRLIENQDRGGLPLGVLPHLRRLGTFQTSSGVIVEVEAPRNVRRLDLAIAGEILCQYLEFSLSLT